MQMGQHSPGGTAVVSPTAQPGSGHSGSVHTLFPPSHLSSSPDSSLPGHPELGWGCTGKFDSWARGSSTPPRPGTPRPRRRRPRSAPGPPPPSPPLSPPPGSANLDDALGLGGLGQRRGEEEDEQHRSCTGLAWSYLMYIRRTVEV